MKIELNHDVCWLLIRVVW